MQMIASSDVNTGCTLNIKCTDDYCSGHGECTVANGTRKCACQLGYAGWRYSSVSDRPTTCSGPTCKMEIDICTFSPCDNGGSCTGTAPGTYICTCPTGFSGQNCSVPLTASCAGNPCQNGGTCVEESTGKVCFTYS